MEKNLSCSVSIHKEKLDGEEVFVVECSELGVSDFGDTVEEALDNLRNGINLLLEEAPEKKELLFKENPIMVTKLTL